MFLNIAQMRPLCQDGKKYKRTRPWALRETSKVPGLVSSMICKLVQDGPKFRRAPNGIEIGIGAICVRRPGTIVAHIAPAIEIRVQLIGVGDGWAIIASVTNRITIDIELIQVMRVRAIVHSGAQAVGIDVVE